MLSRVAESLYWMARYIERAEDLTRVLAVHFQALLDARHATRSAAGRRSWRITGDEPAFPRSFRRRRRARACCEFFVAHPGELANGVVASIARARENARACATRSAARCGST